MIEGFDIVCIASANWGSSNRVNCHLLMERLAARNRVLFVETTGLRAPGRRELGRAINRLFLVLRGVRRAKDNLWVMSPLALPMHNVGLARGVNRWLLKLQVAWGMKRLGFARPILWAFLPYAESLIGRLSESLVVYHCVDNYSENPGVDKPSVSEADSQMAARADVILTTSPALFEHKRRINSNTHYWPNVADTALFERALSESTTVSREIEVIPEPRIGYIGNMASYKIDIDLLRQVAAANPHWSFVFIGPVGIGDPLTDVSTLARLENVYLLGPKDYFSLPQYIKGFDVCTIPFRVSESTKFSFPMKFFEYLASGRPVVGTSLPSLSAFDDLFRAGNSPEEFSTAIRDVLENDTLEERQRRVTAARSHSWDGLVEEISMVISDSRRSRHSEE